MKKKVTALLVVSSLVCLLFSACVPEKPVSVTEFADEEQRLYQLKHDAEMRAKFASSKLHEYSVSFTETIFTTLFPEKDILDYKIDVTKDSPDDEEIEEVSDERAAELFRTGNFTVSILSNEGTDPLTNTERDMIMQAFAERKFTVVLNLSGYWEDDYITDGEIHTEPKPMY
ncbi:MAG: hypothetical protein J6X60_12455 [Ruminiclostridium sp.]|nr:hypothetical protein [Ruminiclostridium sp.]